jgi:hypothetical protein
VSEFCITCPATGTRVSTGVKASAKLLSEPLAVSATLMTCSACGNTHVWTPRGAIVIEDDQRTPFTDAKAQKQAARARPSKRKMKTRRNVKATHQHSEA